MKKKEVYPFIVVVIFFGYLFCLALQIESVSQSVGRSIENNVKTKKYELKQKQTNQSINEIKELLNLIFDNCLPACLAKPLQNIEQTEKFGARGDGGDGGGGGSTTTNLVLSLHLRSYRLGATVFFCCFWVGFWLSSSSSSAGGPSSSSSALNFKYLTSHLDFCVSVWPEPKASKNLCLSTPKSFVK